MSQVTSQRPFLLRVQLQDWEGSEAYSVYEHFYLSGEELNYR